MATVDRGPWRADLRRRVQHYGYVYGYARGKGGVREKLGALPDWACQLGARLVDCGYMSSAPEQLIVNEYEPGQGISNHVDCRRSFGPVVASLSLASDCEMCLLGPDGQKESLWLVRRSLLVLAGEARSCWGHAIPARKSDRVDGVRRPRGRRVSLTFRTVLSGS